MSIESLRKKIALGTVQLGLPYGVNNTHGKPSTTEAFAILDLAKESGIKKIDTAEAYGTSMDVISSYLAATPEAEFDIVSKFIRGEKALYKQFHERESVLKPLYGYMFHRVEDYFSEESREDLLRLRHEKKILKIGVSMYNLDHAQRVLDDEMISIIQIPFNPLDVSKAKNEFLLHARREGKEIHVRSIFLQGLFFKHPEELTGNLSGLSHTLKTFHSLIARYDYDVTQACLNFALHNPLIDFVVIGVETVEQLRTNLESISSTFPNALQDELAQIAVHDASLLNPSNWKF